MKENREQFVAHMSEIISDFTAAYFGAPDVDFDTNVADAMYTHYEEVLKGSEAEIPSAESEEIRV